MVAHGQAILECCGLGLDGGRVVRCCEASPERHRKPSSAAAKALREVQSESPGRHGGGCEGEGGVWKMRGLKGTAKVWLLASKNYGMQRNFASLPRPARERPGQTWLRKLLVTWRSCPLPGIRSLGIWKFGSCNWLLLILSPLFSS